MSSALVQLFEIEKIAPKFGAETFREIFKHFQLFTICSRMPATLPTRKAVGLTFPDTTLVQMHISRLCLKSDSLCSDGTF